MRGLRYSYEINCMVAHFVLSNGYIRPLRVGSPVDRGLYRNLGAFCFSSGVA